MLKLTLRIFTLLLCSQIISGRVLQGEYETEAPVPPEVPGEPSPGTGEDAVSLPPPEQPYDPEGSSTTEGPVEESTTQSPEETGEPVPVIPPEGDLKPEQPTLTPVPSEPEPEPTTEEATAVPPSEGESSTTGEGAGEESTASPGEEATTQEGEEEPTTEDEEATTEKTTKKPYIPGVPCAPGSVVCG